MTSNDCSGFAPQDVDGYVCATKKIGKQPPRKRGAPRGNRNRFKNGLYTNEAKALRSLVAAWKRETRLLLAQIEQ